MEVVGVSEPEVRRQENVSERNLQVDSSDTSNPSRSPLRFDPYSEALRPAPRGLQAVGRMLDGGKKLGKATIGLVPLTAVMKRPCTT